VTDQDRGQIDSSAAEVYQSLFVPALFGRFSDPIAEAAGIRGTDSVVDIACGTGVLTRAVRALTSGRVVGIDINPAMVAVASRYGDDIEFIEGDAASLDLADDSFDVAVSQFGLMFLDDPPRGIVEMDRVADRGLVAVWGPIEQSDGYTRMQDLFGSELGEEAASSLDAPFAMGRDGVLESVFDSTEVADVDFTSIVGSARFDSISQWVTTEVRGWTLGDSITDSELADLIETANESLSEFQTNDGVEFRMTARVARWD
jgi:SAM-dependent methyltransferase